MYNVWSVRGKFLISLISFPDIYKYSSDLGKLLISVIWLLYICNNQITEINNLHKLRRLDIRNNQITEIKNLPKSLKELWINNNLIEYINPVLYKHKLKYQLCNFINTTPDRLKLCYLYKIAYLIPKLQRWWRKKNIQLKSRYKIDINTEIKYKPKFGIEYYNDLKEIQDFLK